MASTTFPQFSSFPPEIHSLILESCPPGDLTCLRLTCKYLYNLSPSKTPIPLNTNDNTNLCTYTPSKPLPTNHHTHRHTCHTLALTEAEKRGLPITAAARAPKRCKAKRYWEHCECFSRRSTLHNRLRTWMPTGLRYCGTCNKFTQRKKSHKGICYHGRSKPWKRREMFWTHRRGRGAFGYRVWKKWFNNAAMNKLEGRLRGEGAGNRGKRSGNERYGLRTLQARGVDSKEVRDSRGCPW